jgi:hypothetical protein
MREFLDFPINMILNLPSEVASVEVRNRPWDTSVSRLSAFPAKNETRRIEHAPHPIQGDNQRLNGVDAMGEVALRIVKTLDLKGTYPIARGSPSGSWFAEGNHDGAAGVTDDTETALGDRVRNVWFLSGFHGEVMTL